MIFRMQRHTAKKKSQIAIHLHPFPNSLGLPCDSGLVLTKLKSGKDNKPLVFVQIFYYQPIRRRSLGRPSKTLQMLARDSNRPLRLRHGRLVVVVEDYVEFTQSHMS
jgi:hypothetical protein